MLIFSAIILSVLQALAHDFHVSVTNAEYKDDSRKLQISLKVFIEDLEDALSDTHQRKIKIENAGIDPTVDQLVYSYLQEKFTLANDADTLELQYVGHEIEVDICFIYMEIADFPVDKELFVGNSLFFDRFEDQSNIINIRYQEEVYSVFLDRHYPVKKVRFD